MGPKPLPRSLQPGWRTTFRCPGPARSHFPRAFRCGGQRPALGHRPGLLLLGDAAHPMSPIAAQGINMPCVTRSWAANWLGAVWRGKGRRQGRELMRPWSPFSGESGKPEIRQAQAPRSGMRPWQGDLLRRSGCSARQVAWLSPWIGLELETLLGGSAANRFAPGSSPRST